MSSIAAGGHRTSQVTVDTTSGGKIVAAAAPGRHSITIINLGTNDVYVGTAGVTNTTGALLVGIKGASITMPTQDAVYGYASPSQAVSVLETL